MRKTIIAVAAIVMFTAISVWANESLATIREVKGRVEIKSSGGEWALASVGAVLAKDTVVSTGFNSQAIIALGDSVLTVKPITRLTLEDIVRQEGSESVRLYLLAGRVKAEVHAPVGGKTDFKVKSPTATASVRGTELTFDTHSLEVLNGVVEFTGASGGPAVQVAQGETSYVDDSGSVTVAVPVAALAAAPPPVPAAVETTFYATTQPVVITTAPPAVIVVQEPSSTTGTIGITVGW
jgi:hypothetical protein